MENKRTFAEIAHEIKQTWKNVYFGAKPYLDAMSTIHSCDKNHAYICEDAYSTACFIACGFLANASTWRGEDARRIKAELKSMIR